jgi:hypothetical protein
VETNGTGQPEARAEELIVEIYRQRDEHVRRGNRPVRVVVSRKQYFVIQDYRLRLGEVAHGKTDYLDQYRLFDLDICIGDVSAPLVEPGE